MQTSLGVLPAAFPPCTAPQARCVWPGAAAAQQDPVLRALCLEGITTLMGKNPAAGTEWQNEQSLLPGKVCPFLSASAEVKMTSPEI